MLNQITPDHCPGMANLLLEDEAIDDLMKLSPEDILLRWVNYHLERAGTNRRCKNFSSDISDSEVYACLLHEIAPTDAGVNMALLEVMLFNILNMQSHYKTD